MTRKSIITLHLFLAAFLTPILLVIAISGGLYLFGEKGSVAKQPVYQGELGEFSFDSNDKESQVVKFLAANNIEHTFDYIKSGSRFMITRPTSKIHFLFEQENGQLVVTQRTPDFIASMIEIHKGHGSRAMKLFQKVVAMALLIVLISGLYLGLSSPQLKTKTILISGAGLATFLLLVIV